MILKAHRGQRGFTLIELLIVIAVLGVLAGVAVPNVQGFMTAGKVQAANTEAANVETAAQAYYGSNGNYPADSSLLTTDYLSGSVKAKYYFHGDTGKIGNAAGKYVDSVAGGWETDGLQFKIDGRRFIKAADDADDDNGTDTVP